MTRCSNNYGPYQFPEKVIPLFVTNLMDGLPVPLYGAPARTSEDWLHVDDHCNGIQLVLDRGRAGEVYNIGGGTELTNVELTELILDAMGAGPEMVKRVADRKGHDLRYSVDISKISQSSATGPQVPFADGLADTIAWYQNNEDWWRPLRPRWRRGRRRDGEVVGGRLQRAAGPGSDGGAAGGRTRRSRPGPARHRHHRRGLGGRCDDRPRPGRGRQCRRLHGRGRRRGRRGHCAAHQRARPGGTAAAVAARPGTRLVQVSTDYVFDGTATEPYAEEAPITPASAYGRTKAAGEEAVLAALPDTGYVVRTAWLYAVNGSNFVKTMLRLEQSHDTLSVVDDQRGQPTWSRDLAEQILLLVDADAPAGSTTAPRPATRRGSASRAGSSNSPTRTLQRVPPTTTDKFPRPAPRLQRARPRQVGRCGSGADAPMGRGPG